MAVAPQLFHVGFPASPIEEALLQICISLQISETTYSLAEKRYHAIGDWLGAEDSTLSAYRPRIYSQGSMKIGTTVKPIGHDEYDVDLVCELAIDPATIQNPVDLLNAIEARLQEHQIYKQMIERKNRCIRINYAGEFHLDILPGVPDRFGKLGSLYVPDRKLQCLKASNPSGYAHWFLDQCEVKLRDFLKRAIEAAAEPLPPQEAAEEKPTLKRVVQLLKRARDIAFQEVPDAAPVSIVITTLAATHYDGNPSAVEAMSTVLHGIVNAIPPRWTGRRLVVLNPTNPKEDFSEKWNDESKYQAFVGFITQVAASWADLEQASGVHKASPILDLLFGKELVKSVLVKQGNAVRGLREAGALGVTSAGLNSAWRAQGGVRVPGHTFDGEAQ